MSSVAKASALPSFSNYRAPSGGAVLRVWATPRRSANEAAVRAISDKQHLGIKFMVGNDHAESLPLPIAGRLGVLRAPASGAGAFRHPIPQLSRVW
jgi:hypothetical protein